MGIDALTSALATSPTPAAGLIGAQRERTESASASPSTEEPSAPTRVVFNPRSHYDASAGVFVMEYRSASTGEVERQFPDEQQLRAYENAKKLEAESARDKPAMAGAALDSAVSASAVHAPRARAESRMEEGGSAKTYQPMRIEV